MLSRQHISGGLAMPFEDGLFGMTVTYIDSGNNTATREFMMDTTVVDYDGAETAALAMLPDAQAVSDAPIASYRIFKQYDESALIIPTVVQIENTASITVLLYGAGNKKGNKNIPAPKIALFVAANGPQSNIVNTTNTVLNDFLDNFRTGTGKFTLSDGEKMARPLSGKRVHKKSNKG